VILAETVSFSFLAFDMTVVSGTLVQKVVNADDKTCDNYWTIHVSPTSSYGIDRLIINQYTHPALKLYGAYRSDLVPGGVAPDHVQRSPGLGNKITFKVNAVVQPSEVSRPLLLDTFVGKTHKTGTVQLRATDGSLSAPIATWVPVWP